MTFRDYQEKALETDLYRAKGRHDRLAVALTGLMTKAGPLAELSQRLVAETISDEDAAAVLQKYLEELLWYMASVASAGGVALEDVAAGSMKAIQDRWGAIPFGTFYDADNPEHEQLLRNMVVRFEEILDGGRLKLHITSGGMRLGNTLTDNAHDPDGYRFHDIMHVAHAVFLHWSPAWRNLTGRKRKSNPVTDEVEDGARARDIEESVTETVFAHARDNHFFATSTTVDTKLLHWVKERTKTLEVRNRTEREWERAILEGYRTFRKLKANNGGIVTIDLVKQVVRYRKLDRHENKVSVFAKRATQ